MKKKVIIMLLILINNNYAMNQKKGFANPDFKVELQERLEKLSQNKEYNLAQRMVAQNQPNNDPLYPPANSPEDCNKMDVDSE